MCPTRNTVATIDRSALFVPGNVVCAFQRGWGGRWPRPTWQLSFAEPGSGSRSLPGACPGVAASSEDSAAGASEIPLRPQQVPLLKTRYRESRRHAKTRTPGTGNVEIRISRADLPTWRCWSGPRSPHDRWSPTIWTLRQLGSLGSSCPKETNRDHMTHMTPP
jgi:hypothetical protein